MNPTILKINFSPKASLSNTGTTLFNPRSKILRLRAEMQQCQVDLIGISAGFDYHEADWGGLLKTEDYHEIGRQVRAAAQRSKGGCFAILEGGYNHEVLGTNVMALINGLSGQ